MTDGYLATKVKFRCVIFRPFPYEVITGRISEMDNTGILVSVGFYHQIYISVENLKDGSIFTKDENSKSSGASSKAAATGIWSWIYKDEDSEDENSGSEMENEPTKLDMRKNDEIRLEVTDIAFKDVMVKNEDSQSSDQPYQSIKDRMENAPFLVRGQIRTECLGLLPWWGED